MTDKTMPTNIWALKSNMDSNYTGTFCDTDDGGELYTRVHDNPDYHVIKKSDVDEDVMGALTVGDIETMQGMIKFCIDNGYRMGMHQGVRYDGSLRNSTKRMLAFAEIEDAKTIRKTLIAQSDPDIVRIPRTVLAGMKWSGNEYDAAIRNNTINDVLNYKEGDDA